MVEMLGDLFRSEGIGWFAVALFAISYIVKREIQLLIVQAVAALIWIAYGLAHGTMPVVIANVVVASFATFKAVRMQLGSSRRGL